MVSPWNRVNKYILQYLTASEWVTHRGLRVTCCRASPCQNAGERKDRSTHWISQETGWVTVEMKTVGSRIEECLCLDTKFVDFPVLPSVSRHLSEQNCQAKHLNSARLIRLKILLGIRTLIPAVGHRSDPARGSGSQASRQKKLPRLEMMVPLLGSSLIVL